MTALFDLHRIRDFFTGQIRHKGLIPCVGLAEDQCHQRQSDQGAKDQMHTQHTGQKHAEQGNNRDTNNQCGRYL